MHFRSNVGKKGANGTETRISFLQLFLYMYIHIYRIYINRRGVRTVRCVNIFVKYFLYNLFVKPPKGKLCIFVNGNC